jgi:hypothetical protein
VGTPLTAPGKADFMTDKAYPTVDLHIFRVCPCFLRFFYDLHAIHNSAGTTDIPDPRARWRTWCQASRARGRPPPTMLRCGRPGARLPPGAGMLRPYPQPARSLRLHQLATGRRQPRQEGGGEGSGVSGPENGLLSGSLAEPDTADRVPLTGPSSDSSHCPSRHSSGGSTRNSSMHGSYSCPGRSPCDPVHTVSGIPSLRCLVLDPPGRIGEDI